MTVVPEIKNFFGMAPPEPLRIAQLLGLPPETATVGDPDEYTYMLVLHGRKEDGSTISAGIKSVKTTAEYFEK